MKVQGKLNMRNIFRKCADAADWKLSKLVNASRSYSLPKMARFLRQSVEVMKFWHWSDVMWIQCYFFTTINIVVIFFLFCVDFCYYFCLVLSIILWWIKMCILQDRAFCNICWFTRGRQLAPPWRWVDSQLRRACLCRPVRQFNK